MRQLPLYVASIVILTATSGEAIPEPTGLSLLAVGLFLVSGLRRVRNRSSQ